MVVFRNLLLLVMLCLASAVRAQDASGTWAIEAGGRTLSLIELRRDPSTGWTGGWTRPGALGINPGPMVEAGGPIVRRPILSGADRGGTIELTIQGRDPAGDPDVFLFRLIDADHAELAWRDVPVPPLALIRAGSGAAVASGWAEGRAYPLTTPLPVNAEMAAVFAADQADRQAGPATDWAVVTPRDIARRARTRALLDAGALRSGDDFYHAAFVFQHGETAEDYLLAHSLAIISASRGRRDATWIAAATLDRYLQKIGQPQIYGTQYRMPPGQPTTQEPYDRSVVSDALRAALGVPDQEGQEQRRLEFERQRPAAGR